MSELRFGLVDVFAVEPLSGNPLAVVLDAEGLGDRELALVARELNQSETTFVLPPVAGGERRLRSFTPMQTEIYGAGHNSLGAWWWLAERGELALSDGVNRFTQEIGGALLAVEIVAAAGAPVSVVLEQTPPAFGASPADLPALAAALGIGADELAVERLPAQVVSTGDAHLMLPVRDRDAVDRIAVDPDALLAILEPLGAEGCYPFSLDPRHPDAHAYARFLNPTDGLWEDPASGGAAGPLVCHLHAHGLVGRETPTIVEQGTAIGRSSLIEVRLTQAAVNVRGSAVTVAEGTLRL